MTVIFFKTDTQELVHTQKNRKGCTVEMISDAFFVHTQLNPANYTVVSISSTYTRLEFEKHCYVEGITVGYRDHLYTLITLDKNEITADGVDVATISNCPEGAEVLLDSEAAGVIPSDGIFEVTASVPKLLKVILNHPHYFPEEITINAT